MLVVNNSKNPVPDAKSSAKYSKVGEEAGSLEPCEGGVVDGTIVMTVYTVAFLISRSRKLEGVASPAQRSQHR